jgi:hypothetical protein
MEQAFKEKRSMRKSLSKWYNGKSRSFTSLADAQRLGGAGGLRKPEHLQVQRRQKRTMSSGNLMATMAAAGAGGGGGSRSRPGSGKTQTRSGLGGSHAVLNELVEAELTEMMGTSFGGCGRAATSLVVSDACTSPAIDLNGDLLSPVGRRKSLLGKERWAACTERRVCTRTDTTSTSSRREPPQTCSLMHFVVRQDTKCIDDARRPARVSRDGCRASFPLPSPALHIIPHPAVNHPAVPLHNHRRCFTAAENFAMQLGCIPALVFNARAAARPAGTSSLSIVL